MAAMPLYHTEKLIKNSIKRLSVLKDSSIINMEEFALMQRFYQLLGEVTITTSYTEIGKLTVFGKPHGNDHQS